MVEGEQAQADETVVTSPQAKGRDHVIAGGELAVTPEQHRQRWLPHVVLLALLAGAMGIHLYHLDHSYITSWDEAVHAIVAEHVAQHPFVPTLYEVEALPPADLTHWDSVHIWLHILPFGMWMAGISMRIFGDVPLALRLPGVLFIAIGMVATYRLGCRLFGASLAGLVGAFFVGFGPLALAVNQGYAFGDMTDTPLIGLTPLLVLMVVVGWQTGKLRWFLVAGGIQSCLYLAKGALGLAPLAVVVALYLSDWVFRPEAGWCKPGWRAVLAFFAAAAVIIVPLTIYFNATFPQTMAVENQSWRKGFFGNLEGWGGAPDYHVTIYFYVMFGTALALLLVVAALAIGFRTVLRQSRADLVLIMWILAVYLPISLAVSKTPTMAVPAIAAFGLVAGRFISLTVLSRQRLWQAIGLGIVSGAAVMALILMTGNAAHFGIVDVDLSPHITNPSIHFFGLKVAGRQNPYLVEYWFSWVMALAFGGIFYGLDHMRPIPMTPRLSTRLQARLPYRRAAILALAFVIVGGYIVSMDVAFVVRPAIAAGPGPIVGPYLEQHTTPNTTILIDDQSFTAAAPYNGHDNLMVMFWAHRDTYTAPRLDAQALCPLVFQAAQKASPIVLVTQHIFPGMPIGAIAGWSLYRLDNTCG